MKKILVLLVCCLVLVGCGKENQNQSEATMVAETQTEDNTKETQSSKKDNKKFPTSEQLLLALKSKNENLIDIEVFDENTDPNGNLGRPGNYITKADFSDSRVEQTGEYLCGGTIETFSNKEDCKKRADYLKKLSDPSMGAFGVNQYIYEYDLSVFRVEYDLTPEQAEEYHEQMTEIIEEWKKTGEIVLSERVSPKGESSSSEETIISQLMETYKEEAENKLSYSEKDSNSYFEVVLKSSKELAKSEPNAEKLVNNQLFNPFAMSAGYLCNNYGEDTDYGKVGKMAFDLIGHIVAGNVENKEKILNEFDTIADEYGMTIITLDETENQTEEITEMQALEPIELTNGNYVVGEDIPVGKYDIVGVESGNIYVSSNGGKSSNVLIESIKPGETVYKNLKLEDGYIVEIVSGGKVRLETK